MKCPYHAGGMYCGNMRLIWSIAFNIISLYPFRLVLPIMLLMVGTLNQHVAEIQLCEGMWHGAS